MSAAFRPSSERSRCCLRVVLVAWMAWLAWLALAPATALAEERCLDEDLLEAPGPESTEPLPPGADPHANLQVLVRDALERSQAVGAARLLADAAMLDVATAQAASRPQAGLSVGIGPGGSRNPGQNEAFGLDLRGKVVVSLRLFDGGRTEALLNWREQLGESARLGLLTAREQLAMTTISLALERSRYRQHVVLYGQYTRRMDCLVKGLETTARADLGHGSELVQARKVLQQVERLQARAQSQARQVEMRLRRLVGDGLPGSQGLDSLLLDVEPLQTLMTDVDRPSGVAPLNAEVAAARAYAIAVGAGGRPQVSWAFTGGVSASAINSGPHRHHHRNQTGGGFSLGLAVTVPLYVPGHAPAAGAAQRRAEAALLQREEALQARRWRVAELHEQTLASFDRARRLGSALRDSEQLRNVTLQQWQQRDRRSVFDVLGAEAEHYSLRIGYVNALHDGQQLNALLLSMGRGVTQWLQ
jgi:adhesin transport system outer membrane protein